MPIHFWEHPVDNIFSFNPRHFPGYQNSLQSLIKIEYFVVYSVLNPKSVDAMPSSIEIPFTSFINSYRTKAAETRFALRALSGENYCLSTRLGMLSATALLFISKILLMAVSIFIYVYQSSNSTLKY